MKAVQVSKEESQAKKDIEILVSPFAKVLSAQLDLAAHNPNALQVFRLK